MNTPTGHALPFAIERCPVPRHWPRRGALVLALSAAMCCAGSAAATVVVSTEAELVQAIHDANDHPGADGIELAADITLSAALPAVTDALTIAGSGGQRVIRRDDSGVNTCSPTAENAFRPVSATTDLTLMDITVTGGCNLVDGGGGVRVDGADLHLVRATITGNQTFVDNPDLGYTTGGHGGGAFVIYGSLTAVDSTVSNNSTHGEVAGGGGIAVYAGSVELRHSTVTGNRAEGFAPMGGGVYAVGNYAAAIPGAVTLVDSTIADNTVAGYSPKGAGVYVLMEAANVSDSRITGNTILGDDQEYARGAGLWVTNLTGDVESRIERTVIAGNSVTGLWAFGGGLHVINGKMTVDASAIVNNTVTGTSKARAGGVFAETCDLVITNSTIAGNAISGVVNEGGGGMQVITFNDSPMTVLLLNSTVFNNASPQSSSGGILLMSDTEQPVDPVMLIESSIVAGNQGVSGFNEIGIPGTPGTEPVVVANNSLVQGTVDVGAGVYAVNAATQALVGLDPLLAPLAENGGPTPSHALQAGSPALDAGSNLFGLAWDQRGPGFRRSVGVATDIGAYEVPAETIFANGFD